MVGQAGLLSLSIRISFSRKTCVFAIGLKKNIGDGPQKVLRLLEFRRKRLPAMLRRITVFCTTRTAGYEAD